MKEYHGTAILQKTTTCSLSFVLPLRRVTTLPRIVDDILTISDKNLFIALLLRQIRTNFTFCENSFKTTFLTGLPQCSVFSLPLFSLYIFQIEDQNDNCQYHLYAEDTQLY